MIKARIVIILFTLFYVSANAAEMILPENEKYLDAFYTQLDKVGWNVELKGKVISIGARDYSEENELAEHAEDKTEISVRLYNNLGLNKGDILYIIDSKNLVIGKLKVIDIFKSFSFGYILIGDVSKNPVLYNSKGDYYFENDQLGEAINQYKNAIEADKNNPEAHINLGYIYLKQELLQLAGLEFKEAEKYKSRIIDNEDKYFLFKGMAEVRFREAYYTRIPDDIRNKYIRDGIEYSKLALEIFPDSKEVNFYLGIFYYKNSNPSDIKAKEYLLKVISLDQNNIDAFIALAELYEKHKNKDKAISYAEQALKIDPANDKAKFILNKLK